MAAFTQSGSRVDTADPYGYAMEVRPRGMVVFQREGAGAN